MIYLVLCIFFNAAIFICFKFYSKYNVPLLPAIVINYCICVITGAFYSGQDLILQIESGFAPWMYFAVALGFIFLGTFYLMAYVTHKFSISVSSISAKISLVIPVLFSLFILKTRLIEYNFLNYIGMAGALGAIVLSSWKNRKIQVSDLSKNDLWLPFALFFLNGLIDTSINFVSNRFLPDAAESVFPIFIFLTAAVSGILILLIKKVKLNRRIWIGGLALGIINYFSVFTLVKSLSAHNDDGAFVYPVLNLGIIIAASVVSLAYFKEHFSKLNWAGFILAILSLVLISYQSIF
jgi:drug/metabolite transporter (DMT)-like permease